MNQYETGFIVAPNLPEEEASALINQLAEVIPAKNGQMIKKDFWGKRKLAYPIKRFNEGLYVFFIYQGSPAVPAELERRFKQTDAILRFMTIKRDPRDVINGKKKVKTVEAPETAPAGAEPQTEESSREEVK
ncbi:MAG: 30S ribosomal protein S6 [Candidatus Saccharicenans sp.]|uniref:30S ribosomal protein S6 n=1 Tax=Candidatus Saccharicenans sp. TaxID=2819258 RepID=UPI0040492D20